MSPYFWAASSILASDRNKSSEFGGQKLTHIDRIDVEGDDLKQVRLTCKDGREAVAMIMPLPAQLRPKDRDLAPADVHDTVLAAVFTANESLTQ